MSLWLIKCGLNHLAPHLYELFLLAVLYSLHCKTFSPPQVNSNNFTQDLFEGKDGGDSLTHNCLHNK